MALPIGSPIPLLEGSTEWINGSISLDDLHRVQSLFQFWAISCPICKLNVPPLLQLTEAHSSHGLRLISIHMPRMEADMDVEKVKGAMEEMGLTGPCAIDNNHVLGERFQTGGVWPCYFLFDAEGKLRSRAAGALGLKMAENSLRRMLGTETEKPNLAGTLR